MTAQAADLTDDWIGRTVTVHHDKRAYTGRVQHIARTPLGLVQIDLDTGHWLDVPAETVITDQEVPWQ